MLNTIFEDDNLFILIFIALGICLIMGVGWLEVTLLYVYIVLVLLNGLEELSFKLNVTSKKLTIFKFELISIFNPTYLKALITFIYIFDVKGPLLLGIEINPLSIGDRD